MGIFSTCREDAHLDRLVSMNYRDYKIFAPAGIYHFFNRGVNKEEIFKDDSDYILFLRRFKEQITSTPLPVAKRNSYHRKIFPSGLFKIYSYCLMPNHFHFLIQQLQATPVSELFHRVVTGYSKVFNLKYGRVGALFQDQYKAVRVENDEQLLWVSGYIHQNPHVAGLVDNLEDWQWSSYLDYIGKRKGILVDTSFILGLPTIANNHGRYKSFVDSTYEVTQNRKDIEHLLLD